MKRGRKVVSKLYSIRLGKVHPKEKRKGDVLQKLNVGEKARKEWLQLKETAG